MSQKIIGFIQDIGFAFLMAFLLLYFLVTDASLHVTCELQADNTYTCDIRDVLLGWDISNTHVEQVVGIEGVSDCSGNTKASEGCSYTAHFQTTTGEKVRLGKFFNAVPKVSKELVTTIDNLMIKNTPVIDHTASQSVLFSLTLFSCITPLMILRAFIRLSPKSDKPRVRTLISWKPKED